MEDVAVIDPAFWRGRRVLLTGHTGFKGSWMCAWLDRLGARVIGYALAPPTCPSLFEEAALERRVDSRLGDVRDCPGLEAAVRDAQPEVVFHLAAQALVRRSYQEPTETYGTNVMGTVHLMQAVRSAPSVGCVVVVTSDKCYENVEREEGYRESARLGGHDPYSSSKAASELVVAAYRSSFFHGTSAPGVATARAGNVIGGGDWAADRLLPDLLAGFAAGRAVPVRSPDAVRPWQHVLDPVGGYLLLAERLAQDPQRFSGAWNFGPSQEDARAVSWVADRVAHHWGRDARWVSDAGERPHEAGLLRLDATKARRELGWSPHWDVERALGRTVSWHRAWLGRPGPDATHGSMVDDVAAWETAPAPSAPTP